MDNQTKEKKEEGMRGWGVDVSLGLHLVGFRRTQYITSIGLFYKKVGFYLELLGMDKRKRLIKREW